MQIINTILYDTAAVFIALAVILAILSLIRFSYILIQLIILEVLTGLFIAIICLWALLTSQAILIDICLTLALVMFLGVVAFYRFLSTRGLNHADTDW